MVSGITWEASRQTRQTGDNLTHTHTTTPAAVFNSPTILHLHSPLKITHPPAPLHTNWWQTGRALPPPTLQRAWLQCQVLWCGAGRGTPRTQRAGTHTQLAHIMRLQHRLRCQRAPPHSPSFPHSNTGPNPTSCNAMVQLPPCKTVFCDQCCMHAQRHGHHHSPAPSPPTTPAPADRVNND